MNTDKDNSSDNNYMMIINEIEKVRCRNNVNWMDILRLSFKHAPEESKKIMAKINNEDDEISRLFKKLSI
jgi:hypothetical protein